MLQKEVIGGVIIIGQHCFNTLGQIRSFGEFGFKPIVIWINHLHQSPKGSKYIKEFHSFDTFSDAIEYVINTYSNNGKKYYLSTDSDGIVALLNEKYNLLIDNFFFFNAGEKGRLIRYMPKLEQCKLAEKFGLNIPRSELVRLGELPKTLQYPIFTKSPDCFGVTWKENSIICKNKEELIESYKKIQGKEILLQEYIEKENEVALEGISHDGGNVVFLPIQGEYIRLSEGKYGTYKRNEHFKLGEDMFGKIQAILKEIHYSGVFEVEFLRDKKGKLYFLEINFRHTQYNHAFTIMGINFCQVWMELCAGNISILENLSLIKDPSFVMNESRDIQEYLLTGKIGLIKWIRDFIKADSYYSFDKKDIAYTFSYFKRMIGNRVNSILNKCHKRGQ